MTAFLGVQLAVAVVVGVFAAAHHLTKGSPAAPAGIQPAGLQIDLGVLLGAALVGTLLAGLAALRMLRRSFGQAGGDAVRAAVGWTPASGRDAARAALTGFVLMAAFAVVGAALPARPHTLGPLARAAGAGGWARLAWAALAVGVAPPVEELVFRGALYAGLARSWRPPWAALATTAVFVALHATELGAYWPAWIAIALLGAFALRARLASGSLLPAIALHASYNLGLVLIAYAR
ncbi:MAG TPA: type II CAAX endopeptidase family protein [Polyangia bacterium]|nr:type II CAAX endopeptidase family protein [Polyangia bacterium]